MYACAHATYVSSHSCLLLFTSTRAAVLRAGLVELPVEVDEERATGVAIDIADAVARSFRRIMGTGS